jgi:hypothetical protein
MAPSYLGHLKYIIIVIIIVIILEKIIFLQTLKKKKEIRLSLPKIFFLS